MSFPRSPSSAPATPQNTAFNFVGALKQFLHADVYNAALTAGGFASAAYRYYATDEYHAHPPKIIVWEFLPQHDYNDGASENGFRQMIPAIYGACDEKSALAHTTGSLGGTTAFFDKIGQVPLKNTYIYLEATEPKERSLQLDVLYTDGNVDQADLTRSTRMANNGKYYFELSSGNAKAAKFFRLTTDVPEGKFTARICPYPGQRVAEK